MKKINLYLIPILVLFILSIALSNLTGAGNDGILEQANPSAQDTAKSGSTSNAKQTTHHPAKKVLKKKKPVVKTASTDSTARQDSKQKADTVK